MVSEEFSEAAYSAMVDELFVRFPSFQKVGKDAYKPGLDNMLFFDQMAGHPHSGYATVHVAGTNGKGSVSNMMAAILASKGLRTGLYTSPHISDFRERMRIVDGRSSGVPVSCIGKEDVWSFVQTWKVTFGHLGLSFFEITTMMAFDWFARQHVDVAVIETGLGGRLDSTNIITPALSIITNIGLDHCDMLGNTLQEIAFEKAGIIKPLVPVVVGESDALTDGVFERKVLYTNLPEVEFMGDRKKIMSLLTFADKVEPVLWEEREAILSGMDLQGEYQRKNLRTVLAAAGVLGSLGDSIPVFAPMKDCGDGKVAEAIMHTASMTDFHGRWERLCSDPVVIADIGHNAHGLRYNFSQLEEMKKTGECTDLVIVFGMVADKDAEAVFSIMPQDAAYVFTNASGRRALPADDLMRKYVSYCSASGKNPSPAESCDTVGEAVARAFDIARDIRKGKPGSRPLIYVGGSTFVVSESLGPVRECSGH